MTDRAQWIEHARDGVEGAGPPDARALAILEAAKGLARLAETREEKQTLVRLTRAAIAMAGVRDDDLRRPYILDDLTTAWREFASAWRSD